MTGFHVQGNRGSFPVKGKGFLAAPVVPYQPRDPPTLIFKEYSGLFPSENSDRGVTLTIYVYKLPRLKNECSYASHLYFTTHQKEFRTLMYCLYVIID
jgi:hypothetical protein